ncbi:ABC-2 type transport system ATP-binding protein [Neomicrococcus aestuarii]|uniref:ABC-2 type transport system ATP-binding protein n=1 Tax=Neomicrococcus aestuarii TaxID=556325 RepID=A0A7W8TS25_9MICC|nr:ABC-2 type transport system ATP-binding protein [Neomicrococcus aestuarii]
MLQPSVLVRDLRKDFGPVPSLDGRMVKVLRGVNFQAAPGEVTTLLGSNGAGKSTTLSCAQGLLKPDGGDVTVLGQQPYRAGSALRSRVGVMLQDGGLPPSARPLALLNLVARMYQHPASVDELADRLGIHAFAHTNIRRLSGGQKQRVAFAAALLGKPEVLFLDEPSAGLDPQSRQIVFDMIQEQRALGTCIVLTTHLMDDAEKLSDRVFIIDRGQTVAEGTVAQLTSWSADASESGELSFEARPGLPVEELTTPSGGVLNETTPGNYRLSKFASPADMVALSQWLDAAQAMPTAMAMRKRTLEDVFLEIAEKSRDE